MVKVLRIMVENNDPYKEYLLSYVVEILGYGMQKKSRNLDIYYGNDSNIKSKLKIRSAKDSPLWDDLFEGNVDSSKIQDVIEFDVLNSIGLFMTDKVNNTDISFLDEHGRLLLENSFPYLNKLEKVPIVNYYIKFLGEIFSNKFGSERISLWPEGYTYAICLSHDVDEPCKHTFNEFPLPSLRDVGVISFFKEIWYRAKALKKAIMDPYPNNYWLFREITKVEKSFDFKSTFFFSSE